MSNHPTTLAAFKRAVTVGSVLRCIENTYIPRLSGIGRTVTKVGPTVYTATVDDQPGKDFRGEWPKAADVVAVVNNRITYRLTYRDYCGTCGTKNLPETPKPWTPACTDPAGHTRVPNTVTLEIA